MSWLFCRDCAWRSSCWPFSRRLCRLFPSPSPSAWSSTSPQTIWYGPSWTAWQPTNTTSDRNPLTHEGLYQNTGVAFQWDSNVFISYEFEQVSDTSELRCKMNQNKQFWRFGFYWEAAHRLFRIYSSFTILFVFTEKVNDLAVWPASRQVSVKGLFS